MLRIVPDYTDCGEQTREESRNGGRFGRFEILARPLEERDKLETVLCTELAPLQGRKGIEGRREGREERGREGGMEKESHQNKSRTSINRDCRTSAVYLYLSG